MTKEELIALGLDEEQVNGVFKIRGKEIEDHKASITSLTESKESAEAAKLILEQEVEAVKKEYVLPKDLESVTAEKEALQTQIDEMTKTHESAVNEINYTNTLESTLNKVGVKDLEFIKFKLNKDNLKFEDGKIEGLDSELSALKESHAHLFADSVDEGVPKFTAKGSGGGSNNVTRDSIMSIKDSSDRLKAISDNKHLFPRG